MRVSFSCNLNHRLDFPSILQWLAEYPATAPQEFALSSDGPDRSGEEALSQAPEVPWGSLTIKTPKGEVSLLWNTEGSESGDPEISGELSLAKKDVGAFLEFLTGFCVRTRCAYAYCDLEKHDYILAKYLDRELPFGETGKPRRPFWFNYFDQPFQDVLPIDERITSLVHSAEILENGAIRVLTRQRPDQPEDPKQDKAIADLWPVFTACNLGVEAPEEEDADTDDGDAEDLEDPSPSASGGDASGAAPATPPPTIEDPNEFIRSAAELSQRLSRWLEREGQAAPETSLELLMILVQEEKAIAAAGLSSAAVAAYGEMTRKETGGRWAVVAFDGREEPALVEVPDEEETCRVLRALPEDMDNVAEHWDELQVVKATWEIAEGREEFLRSLEKESARFDAWLTQEEIDRPTTPKEVLWTLSVHGEDLVREGLVIPAVAAYSLLVQRRKGGEWGVGVGEEEELPCLVKNVKGRPRKQDVVSEALRAIYLDED